MHIADIPRLQTLNGQLRAHDGDLDRLESKLNDLEKKYKTPEIAGLHKDLAMLRKKYDATSQKAAKVFCRDIFPY